MNNIVIVSGSHKANGASDKIADTLAKLVVAHAPQTTASTISLAEVPLWDEGKWGAPELSEKWGVWQPIVEQLRAADALVVVSPEYAGMVPPMLTNFLLLCSGEDVGHKPALAVGVSATRGGAYPIAQLRAFAYKNNHICWLPDHVILRNVGGEQDPLLEGSFEFRYAIYCLKLLDAYASALKGVRASGVVDHNQFPYGM